MDVVSVVEHDHGLCCGDNDNIILPEKKKHLQREDAFYKNVSYVFTSFSAIHFILLFFLIVYARFLPSVLFCTHKQIHAQEPCNIYI